jgi:hypothetical protein
MPADCKILDGFWTGELKLGEKSDEKSLFI